MKWITREKVKVDRVACPWLITKFIDPAAEFIFVPADEVTKKASEMGATPFDFEGWKPSSKHLFPGNRGSGDVARLPKSRP